MKFHSAAIPLEQGGGENTGGRSTEWNNRFSALHCSGMSKCHFINTCSECRSIWHGTAAQNPHPTMDARVADLWLTLGSQQMT